MKLKTLEIKGFKSFPDKVTLHLDQNVMGVVGPNGCGKSNIIDAIRWVIGEHKIRSLRSDNLQDLIFNGSKGRSPSGMAEVSITFENTKNILPTEFTTVTITRKFFRTGESEYRLNNVVCRLKDIHSLLMDTGISSDSYAIIELGMVDDIIRDKDGSRRRMLEQAAGITVYKTRRREAEQKLTATDLDIDRIEDLLFEIANNLKSLEQQAKKAERYHNLRSEYKELSIEFAKASLSDFNDEYQNLQKKNAKFAAEKAAVIASISGEEAAIEKQKSDLVDKEKELHYQQKAFNDLISRIRVLESEKKLTSQHLSHLKERAESIKQIIKQSKEQVLLIKEQQEDLEEKIEEQLDRVLFMEEQVEDEKESGLALQSVFKEYRLKMEEVRKEVEKWQEEKYKIEKEVAIQSQTNASLNKQMERVRAEVEELKLQIFNSQNQIDIYGDKKEKLISQAAVYKQEIEKYENIILKNDNLRLETEELLKDNNRKFDAKTNEYALLNSLISSMEGYSDSIQFLENEKNKGNFKGILLSELFKIPNSLASLVESYFGDTLNYYVVDNKNQAEEAIELLKENNKGKVGFWILNNYEEEIISDEIKHCEKILNTLSFEKKYLNLFTYLFNNLYIVKETDKWHYDVKNRNNIFFLANESKIIAHGKIFGGGQDSEQNFKIGRKYRLEELENEIQDIKKNLEDLSAANQKYTSIIKEHKVLLQAIPLHKIEKELTQSEMHTSSLIQRKEEQEERMDKLLEELDSIEKEAEKIMQQQPDYQSKYTVLQDNLIEKQEDLEQKSKKYIAKEQEVNEWQQKFQMLQISLQQEKNKHAQIKQELAYKNQQFEDINQQIALQSKQLEETQLKISEADGKINFGDDELEELLNRKEKEELKLNALDKDYYASRNKIAEAEQAISGVRKKKEQFDLLIKEVEDALSQMKLQVAGIRERLTVEFNLNLEEVLEEERSTSYTLAELQELLGKVKKRLENLGAVNPTAIDAYQEIKLRHDFILTQKEDLIEARNSLLKTIEEVERTANQKFQETFEAVRGNFIEVFKSLFTENDHADLRLTDPEDIANTNIEIYAQPKGKRPSTLTQLSGGEKTLTSTAFLFAIYLIKPAPFCILDEVDAPLDDANVGKFTQMIREFSDNSQFILVTHNKQTMATMDIIYGVTMQEPGVSKIVPVDFRSLEY